MRAWSEAVQAIVVGGWLVVGCGAPGEPQAPRGGTLESGDAGGGPATAIDAPAMSPAPGTYARCHPDFVQSVTVPVTLSAGPGATVYYTTDGSTPAATSTPYTGPIQVTSDTTIQAVAFAGGAPSPVASGTYSIQPANTYGMAADPVVTPGTGAYADQQKVTITDASAGATIYYAVIDGSVTSIAVTTPAPFTVYTAPFTLDRTSIVEAYASLPGGWCSPALQTEWITIARVAPPLLPASGSYGTCDGAFRVLMDDVTPRATIHYTRDGTTPTAASPLFPPDGLTVDQDASVDLRALATAPGLEDSLVVEGSYSAYQDPDACWQFVF